MSFNEFQFHPKINAGIAACGYTTPTPIQKDAIPSILAGRDMLGLAQTGTGKTAAFVLPLLQRLQDGPRKIVRALIVAPTRELAEQIHENICNMGKQTGLRSVVVYGGVGKQPQIRTVRSGVEIVVACPGRLLDLLNDKAFNLRAVETLVLDEADHMFDKGFLPDIRRIIKQLPRKRQSLVFSATMPKEIRHLAEEIPAGADDFPCALSSSQGKKDLFAEKHLGRAGYVLYIGLHPHQVQGQEPGTGIRKSRIQRCFAAGQPVPKQKTASYGRFSGWHL